MPAEVEPSLPLCFSLAQLAGPINHTGKPQNTGGVTTSYVPHVKLNSSGWPTWGFFRNRGVHWKGGCWSVVGPDTASRVPDRT